MKLDPIDADGTRPLIIQTTPDIPVIVGVGNGENVLCPSCNRVVLLQNVFDDSVYDLAIRCAGCGKDSHTPSFPPGRGLGGMFQGFPNGTIEAVQSLVAEYDEVIIGAPGANRRQVETGRLAENALKAQPRRLTLDAAGIEGVRERARSVFDAILPALEARYARGKREHRLPALLAIIDENVKSVQAGAKEVDVLSVMELENDVALFERWSRDPEFARLLHESKDPNTFDHNILLLSFASVFDDSGFGPEIVPPGENRAPDLRMRISASRSIEADIKAPVALQRRPRESVPTKDAVDLVENAIRSSRGQFATTSILVLAGSFWIGDFDELANSAQAALGKALPPEASPEARLHRENLSGVILASTLVQYGRNRGSGAFDDQWDEVDWTHAREFRWVPNPSYAGDLKLSFADDLSTFDLSYRP